MRKTIGILFLLMAIITYGQIKGKKHRVLEMLGEVSNESNPQKKISLYASVADFYSLFTKDSARLIINAGLDFAKQNSVDNQDILTLKRCKVQVEHDILPREKSNELLKNLLKQYPNANYSNKISILYSIGSNYRASTTFDSSLFYFEQAKYLAESKKDIRWLCSIISEEMSCYEKMSGTDKAYEILDDFLKKHPKAIENPKIISPIARRHYRNREFQQIINIYTNLLKTNSKEKTALDHKSFISQYVSSLLASENYAKAEEELDFHISLFKKKWINRQS